MSKVELGQFYTTQYEYILSNMTIPEEVNTIIEPFVGNGDLLKFVKNREKYTIEMYDIDPKVLNTASLKASHVVVQRDTLRNPPDYSGKFVLTNPPYLARNKSKNKELYDMYDCNDLYKCFLLNLISNVCQGGIVIVPLNFISSIRKSDVELRRQFIETYSILTINIFEEQVFDDTRYAVCSFYFMRRAVGEGEGSPIETYIYPSAKKMTIEWNADNNYTIGGEIYNLPYNETIHVCRATRETKGKPTNILLKCIDDSMTSQLGFKLVADKDIFIDNTPNLSARSYASLVINPPLTLLEQEALVKKMNEYICVQREKYNSLFLTNYRENNTIARKRISFDLAFKICNYMLSESLSTVADSSTTPS